MQDAERRVSKRVTCPNAGTAVQIAPDKTTVGTFRVVALTSNTDKVGWGGEPDLSFTDDERVTGGPIVAAGTQNVPLFDAGYGQTIRGDLGLWWVNARVDDEGICWIRIE